MTDITVTQNEQTGELYRGGEWKCSWEKSEGEERQDYEGAWVIRPRGRFNSSEEYRYYPLEENPPVYLAFAALGQNVWETYGGKFLHDRWPRNTIPEELKTKALGFTHDYGPHVTLHRHRASLWKRSIDTLLSQAQMVRFAVTYQRFATREFGIYELKPYVKAVLDEWFKDEFRSRFERREDFDLDCDGGLIEASEIILDSFLQSELGLGGLRLGSERVKGDPLQSSGWRFQLWFNSLLNVIWYQVYRALVQRSDVRVCRNESCLKPGRLFEADRSNQEYCGKSCRGIRNTRESRRRGHSRIDNLGGLLP